MCEAALARNGRAMMAKGTPQQEHFFICFGK
jgi:hypothetical protein